MDIREYTAAFGAPGERERTACFTGHRFLPPEREDRIAEKTAHVVGVLIRAGYRNFLCGGALGFDTLAERCVVEARQSAPEVRLILALPCRDQTGNWLKMPSETAARTLREYQRLKGLADGVVYVNDFYFDGCMRERNRFMVEHASFCVAYFDGSYRSGAGQTVRMAKRAGLSIYNVWDAMEEGGAPASGRD